jgi:hypothetical protein
MSAPAVDLLWWEGCPSTEATGALLRATLDELGFGSVGIRRIEVLSDEQARELGFKGSPTIRVGGVDLIDLAQRSGEARGDEDAEPALTCRLYRRRDGRISPTPDPADVRDGLVAAFRSGERAA